MKLAKELSKRSTGRTLYILDEPTTGLHFYDIEQLLRVLHRLRDEGNTIVVIEHNLDVIKTADWVIDLGPEGGAGGGRIVATGTPEQIAANEKSFTGEYLRRVLERKAKPQRKRDGGRLVRCGSGFSLTLIFLPAASPTRTPGALRPATSSRGTCRPCTRRRLRARTALPACCRRTPRSPTCPRSD